MLNQLKNARRSITLSMEQKFKGQERQRDPELEDYLNKFDKYSASLSSVNKEGDALYTLLNKISSKSEGFLCSMLEVQSLVHPPDQPEELEEHKAADGMANGCRAYASVFLATFMQVVNKSVAEQKQAAKIVASLRKAQMETDHYLRKLKTLKEKGEKPEKISGNETKLQQAIAEEEQLQGECVSFLNVFLNRAPTELFRANLELLFAQDEFGKTLNESAKKVLENPPTWLQESCRNDQALAMKAVSVSRRSSLPITSQFKKTESSGLPSPPGAPAAGGSSGAEGTAGLQAELEKLKLQNMKGASAYENLRAKAMEWKGEVALLRERLAKLEKEKPAATAISSSSTPTGAIGGKASSQDPLGDFDFGFAPPPAPKTQARPSTPAFSFDPNNGSLI